ncbi:MAG: M56 family metallopeptidase, partial [Acidobacteriota bacterium]|nr:M56 family metallopeptidase [Acidobacteriota bacterium]
GLLAAVAACLPRFCRASDPRFLLPYWQAVFAGVLLLPAWQYFRRGTASPSWMIRFASSATTSHGIYNAGWHVPEVLIYCTVAVACARLIWLAAGLVALSRYRNKSQKLAPAPVHIVQLGKLPRIAISWQITSPVSFGVWRPVILLPAEWSAMSPDHQAAIVCHELLHLERHDWPAHLFEECCRAIFWYHPAVGYAVSRIRLFREQVVDREAVRRTNARDSYIHALLEAADFSGGSLLPAPSFARKHQLIQRIESLTKENRMSKPRTVVSLLFMSAVLFAAGRAALLALPAQSGAAKDSGKVYAMADGITPPRVAYKRDPDYTEQAKAAGIQGTVLLSIEISPKGIPQNLSVTRSLDPGLDQNALDAVQDWRFEPGLKDGEPVTVKATIEMNFKLK